MVCMPLDTTRLTIKNMPSQSHSAKERTTKIVCFLFSYMYHTNSLLKSKQSNKVCVSMQNIYDHRINQ